MKTWRTFLEALVAEHHSARELARLLGVDESKVSRWRRYAESLPNATEAMRLAQLAKIPLERVLLLIAQAETTWLEGRALRRLPTEEILTRPTLGGGSSGDLSRKPTRAPLPVGDAHSRPTKRVADNTRRKKLAGMLAGVGVGLASLVGISSSRAADYEASVGTYSVALHAPFLGPAVLLAACASTRPPATQVSWTGAGTSQTGCRRSSRSSGRGR